MINFTRSSISVGCTVNATVREAWDFEKVLQDVFNYPPDSGFDSSLPNMNTIITGIGGSLL